MAFPAVTSYASASSSYYSLAVSPTDTAIALGSFSLDPHTPNTLALLSTPSAPPSASASPTRLSLLASVNVPYPVTSIAWDPTGAREGRDVLGTTGDALRVYKVRDGRLGEVACLAHTKPIPSSSPSASTSPSSPAPTSPSAATKKNSPAPMTGLSWNAFNPAMVVTSSIDTTCTVWDVNQHVAVTQLIAHDKEVYDVEWLPNSPAQIFVSVGADGSLRAFDLRSLEHSTILYESPAPPATSSTAAAATSAGGAQASGGLVKIAFNPSDPNYLATFSASGSAVQVLDMRSPGTAVVECYVGSGGRVNALAWGSSKHEGRGGLCVGSDDGLLSLFDTSSGSVASILPVNPPPSTSAGSASKSASDSAASKHSARPKAVFDAPGPVDGLAWGVAGEWVIGAGGYNTGAAGGWVRGVRVV